MPEIASKLLGDSGLKVSVVGLGCNNFGRRLAEGGALEVVATALDAGITLFDTADIYSEGQSEEILGKALRGRREQAIIATKFGGQMGTSPFQRGASRRWLRIAVEASLRRLGTEWIDLYQLHFPDGDTPIEETLQTLDDLVHEGKVRYIGSSNFAAWQVADAEWTARTNHQERFVGAQNEYNLLQRSVEAELTPACVRYGIGIIPYSPLASGLLTGKFRRGEAPPQDTRIGKNPQLAQRWLTDRNFDLIESLQQFVERRSLSLLDVAIGGLAAQPQVASVIAGAMTPEQVLANVRAGQWRPSAEDLDELDRITKQA
jgi:aryl-alcohol dehydrogenase-like predicted oxidoreductase